MRVAIGAFLSLTILGCGAAHAGKADDTLNIAFSNEITTMDNYKEASREGLTLARLLYDNLLEKNPKTNEFQPSLAKSWRYVDDKTLEFVIRDGVKFHNGKTLTVDDVVYTLQRVIAPDYKVRWPVSTEWIDKIEKVDGSTVRVIMKAPGPLGLEMLSGNLSIYPKDYYEQVGPEGMSVKPIGTGPYKAVEVVPGSRFVFERNDDYFAESPRPKPAIKRLVTRILPEINTQYVELMNGSLDWLWRVPPKEAVTLARNPKVQMKSTAIVRFAYIQINPHFDGGKSPVADARVRRAIIQGIDREGIRKAFVGGAAEVIDSPCSPTQFGCVKGVTSYSFDAGKAKALLAEAGHPNGFEIELVSWSTMRTEAEAIAASLAKAGITAKLNFQQSSASGPLWREGKVALYLSNWGSYGVQDISLSASHLFGGLADDQAKDPEVIKALHAGDTATDRNKRLEYYTKGLKRIADEALVVPLWTFNVNYAMNKDLDFTLDEDEYGRFDTAKWK
jgi:peptide/nickel transport system substrate-binding protein